MATLQEISRMTGLAPTTVSEILRGKPGYNLGTQQRVRWVAQQLQYRPNPLSRALKGGRSMTLGMLFGGIGVPITAYKASAIEHAARARGYLTFTAHLSDPTAAHPDAVLRDLLERRIDGLIVYQNTPLSPEAQQVIAAAKVPVVYLDAGPAGARHHVIIDRATGMRQIAQHLAPLGHRRVGFVPTPTDLHNPSLKMEPYTDAMAACGIDVVADVRWVLRPEEGFERCAYRLIRHLIEGKQLPSAMLMNNDDGAIAAMAAVHDAGLRVPQDVSIVGFDDLAPTEFLRPALTTVHQPRAEAGTAAFERLFQLMTRCEVESDEDLQPVVFEAQAVVRDSTGPAKVP